MTKQTICVAAIALYLMGCRAGTKHHVTRLEHKEDYYDASYRVWDTAHHVEMNYFIKGNDTVFIEDFMTPPPPPLN